MALRTSDMLNWETTLFTHNWVYSPGYLSGRLVTAPRGRKQGSPASNLKPSIPTLACSAFKRETNHAIAASLVRSIARTGCVPHQRSCPDCNAHPPPPPSQWPGGKSTRSTRTFTVLPSLSPAPPTEISRAIEGGSPPSMRCPSRRASAHATEPSCRNGITHTVTKNPSFLSETIMPFGSGNFTLSNSRSPYRDCHRSSISSTPGR
mmetsp:Transcript_1396/g.5311  ORF Transcript_1396/g.5311 Transcript_1396/m.5311 type:complete len:206 (-) Transcript_1396:1567-2184(-)